MAYSDGAIHGILNVPYKRSTGGYNVDKIGNGYLLRIFGSNDMYYRTKKQVLAAIAKHLMKEVA